MKPTKRNTSSSTARTTTAITIIITFPAKHVSPSHTSMVSPNTGADMCRGSSFPAPCCHRPPVRDLARRHRTADAFPDAWKSTCATPACSFRHDPSADTVRQAHALASRVGKKGTKPRTARKGHSGFELQLCVEPLLSRSRVQWLRETLQEKSLT